MLVVGGCIHKAVSVPFRVQVFHFDFFQIGFFEFITGAKGPVKLSAGQHVFQFALVKGLAFTGFDKFKLNDDIRFTVNFEFQAFF